MYFLEAILLLFYSDHRLLVRMKDNVLDHIEVGSKFFLKKSMLLVKLGLELHNKRLKGTHPSFLFFTSLSACLL